MTAAPTPVPIALTIAGSDSSGGAGIQADLKTFSALGVYGASVITALTAQNTRGVAAVDAVAERFVVAQMEAVLSDLEVGAIKIGMLAKAAIVGAVADRLRLELDRPILVDPVMVASSGQVLLEPDAIDALKRQLLPKAALVTPNLPEAARLLGVGEAVSEAQAVTQARALMGFGCRAVLLKGGHGRGQEAVDILCDGAGIERFARPRIDARNTHGTGCTLSAAIVALLAHGVGLRDAVARAKQFVWLALHEGRHLRIGQARGPVDPLFAIRKAALPV
ncbi:MAG: bifunctional hydroxymethylpyrimidine kinase/phosphomethylpyrimidine kinase [Hyphomicrobiaceae bacterium]|nr:bifunctional hydroxymethylpyrimidine kinase/phosphomethylpyrimidine kinase [Hyphomicrobiaceae bacterium]